MSLFYTKFFYDDAKFFSLSSARRDNIKKSGEDLHAYIRRFHKLDNSLFHVEHINYSNPIKYEPIN